MNKKKFKKQLQKYLPIIKIALALILVLLGEFLPIGKWWKLGIFIAALIVVGIEPLLESIEGFKSHHVDENFLMLIAAIGAFVLGEYIEGVLVLLLNAIGEYFEHYAVNKSRNFISKLVEMRTPYANLIRGNEVVTVEPEELSVGDVIVVKVGERVPVDGVVVDGTTTLDTSALTGESVPRAIKEGDEIISGCVNSESVIKVEVGKKYEESTVAKILDLVESATSRKAKAENFISKFAAVYTPVVVGLAIIVAFIPPIFFGYTAESLKEWIYKALSFLVISCPCALVISVPLSFFRGIGLASKAGILIKGSNYMEKLAKLSTVALDKTGTLTEGKFVIDSVRPSGISEEEFLEIAGKIESGSNHPIAKSIAGDASSEDVSDYTEISGRGVKAVIDGSVCLGGNALLMEENDISFEKYDGVGSVVYFAKDGAYLGYIVVKDKIKDDSYDLKRSYAANGIKKVVMLSGDSNAVCAEVAEKLSIDEYHGQLLPEDKLNYLIAEKGKNKVVAFVGDGINDAPCLAEADVGIAMGGMGSDVAVETADVVIMEDKPTKVAEAAKISRRTVKIATENIVFALSVKVAVMILSVLGIGNILLAIFADVGVSVLAILNAIRPMLKDRKKKQN